MVLMVTMSITLPLRASIMIGGKLAKYYVEEREQDKKRE